MTSYCNNCCCLIPLSFKLIIILCILLSGRTPNDRSSEDGKTKNVGLDNRGKKH